MELSSQQFYDDLGHCFLIPPILLFGIVENEIMPRITVYKNGMPSLNYGNLKELKVKSILEYQIEFFGTPIIKKEGDKKLNLFHFRWKDLEIIDVDPAILEISATKYLINLYSVIERIFFKRDIEGVSN